jgi:hypothetical protein
MARERLGEILIKAGLLDKEGLQRALNEQQRWGGQLGRYLVEMGLITEETLVRALSTQFKIPAVALDPERLDISVGRLITREICERNGLVCFRADTMNKFLDVAMGDPSNLDAIDEVRVATKYNVRPHIAAPSVIDRAISFVFYGDLAVGSELDLGPTSKLRIDSKSSELLDKKRDSLHPDMKATATGLEAASREEHAVELPKPAGREGFHITMDVPTADKEQLKHQSVEDLLARLEATVARNTAIIRALLEALSKKGLFTRQEIREVIGSKES